MEEPKTRARRKTCTEFQNFVHTRARLYVRGFRRARSVRGSYVHGFPPRTQRTKNFKGKPSIPKRARRKVDHYVHGCCRARLPKSTHTCTDFLCAVGTCMEAAMHGRNVHRGSYARPKPTPQKNNKWNDHGVALCEKVRICNSLPTLRHRLTDSQIRTLWRAVNLRFLFVFFVAADSQIHIFTDSQIHRFTRSHVHRFTDSHSVGSCESAISVPALCYSSQVRRFTASQIHRFTDSQVHRFTDS